MIDTQYKKSSMNLRKFGYMILQWVSVIHSVMPGTRLDKVESNRISRDQSNISGLDYLTTDIKKLQISKLRFSLVWS